MYATQFILTHAVGRFTVADVDRHFAERDDRRRARHRALDRLARGLTTLRPATRRPVTLPSGVR